MNNGNGDKVRHKRSVAIASVIVGAIVLMVVGIGLDGGSGDSSQSETAGRAATSDRGTADATSYENSALRRHKRVFDGVYVATFDPDSSVEAIEDSARAICDGQSDCEVFAWNENTPLPNTWPLTDRERRDKRFQLDTSGKALFDCREFKSVPEDRCLDVPVEDRFPDAPKTLEDADA